MSSTICNACRTRIQQQIYGSSGIRIRHLLIRSYTRPSFAPKPALDLKHIRENPGLYEQNSIDRNYQAQTQNSWRILELHEKLVKKHNEVRELRQRNNALGKDLQKQAGSNEPKSNMDALIEEARKFKAELEAIDEEEKVAKEEMEKLALELPNLSSDVTPIGSEPKLLDWIGGERPSCTSAVSHVDIGKTLDILDFEASATTSGWGWYFLRNEGALLEQALIQYALSVAMSVGWTVMTPPSLVYSHIASACGFMPRDQNGETQIYDVADTSSDSSAERPRLVLTGTAEIPFAASQANKTIDLKNLPLKVIGPSRCYRAEAGARGVDTKGLYRVHEFTKVEMFAWTALPSTGTGRFDLEASETAEPSQSDIAFAEMLQIQQTILSSLGLHAKILEMPTQDLGASARRKVDIEAFFPSRSSINGGYGEVTSASMCSDYQTRRLATRSKDASGKLIYPHTLNGTAMAVPRVLACLLENGWDENTRTVRVPEVLRKWMPGNISSIG